MGCILNLLKSPAMINFRVGPYFAHSMLYDNDMWSKKSALFVLAVQQTEATAMCLTFDWVKTFLGVKTTQHASSPSGTVIKSGQTSLI